MKNGLIIGIVISILVIGVLLYNNIRLYREKRKPKIGSQEYIKANTKKLKK